MKNVRKVDADVLVAAAQMLTAAVRRQQMVLTSAFLEPAVRRSFAKYILDSQTAGTLLPMPLATNQSCLQLVTKIASRRNYV